jgi:hypothetical protein
VKPVADRPGEFRTAGVGRTSDAEGAESEVDLVPFYRLHRRTYAVYWDLFTDSEWQEKKAEHVREAERQRQLEAATVAYVQPGEMQPERDFNYQSGEERRPLRVLGRPGRRARSWFSFDVPVESAHPMALVVTYHSGEGRRGRAVFEILVDGQRIAEQKITRSRPARFFDLEYPIDAKLVDGKETITVRFQGTEGNRTAGVFGIRMIRVDAER